MPMRAQSCAFDRTKKSGFTLIEIMAVLIVIGIAAAMVILSIGDATRPYKVKNSAKYLYNGMSMALEDAVFLNRQLGLRFDYISVDGELVYSYEWLYYDYDVRQWQAIAQEDYTKVEMPDFMVLKLEIEGQETLIGAEQKNSEMFNVEESTDDNKKDNKKNVQITPDLYFLSSGEIQAFKITLADKESLESEYIIEGNALGQMTFKRPDEKDE